MPEMNTASPSPTRRSADEEPIRVVVRVRPALDDRSGPSQHLVVEPPDVVVARGRQGEVHAQFDAVLGGEASQADAYEHVGPAVDAAIRGINATVLAYGQTGSGKTHTMQGGSGAARGIIPRVFEHMEDHCEQQTTRGWKCAMQIT